MLIEPLAAGVVSTHNCTVALTIWLAMRPSGSEPRSNLTSAIDWLLTFRVDAEPKLWAGLAELTYVSVTAVVTTARTELAQEARQRKRMTESRRQCAGVAMMAIETPPRHGLFRRGP